MKREKRKTIVVNPQEQALGGNFKQLFLQKKKFQFPNPHLSFFRFPTIIKTHSFPGYLHRFFPSLNKFLILNGQTDQQREINSLDCADTL